MTTLELSPLPVVLFRQDLQALLALLPLDSQSRLDKENGRSQAGEQRQRSSFRASPGSASAPRPAGAGRQ